MIIRLLIPAAAVALLAEFPGLTPHAMASGADIVAGVVALEADFATTPPEPWAQADPADSLYRLGRDAINRGDYSRAARLFAEINDKYPRSEYAPDAPYWRAFALYKSGREDDLREALRALEMQQRRFSRASTIEDGKELAIRIRGVLARQGDVESAETVTRAASQPCNRNDEDNEIRAAAMNALLQMDAESALPIIRQVLQKRDECSVSLREKAVFWLGQVDTDRAAVELEKIATSSPDMELRGKAIHALHEHDSPRAAALLRRLAESEQTPESVREKAIFWIGQRESQENAEFLRSLFAKARTEEARKKIMFSLSQMDGFGNDRWLLGIALDESNSAELRGHALWTAGQAGIPGSELVTVYDRVSDREVKEKLIWVMSESRDRAATDKLIEIARRDPDREMRKKALFWLGQKNDPRVRQILIDILNQP
jgi:HEAT repeat protein